MLIECARSVGLVTCTVQSKLYKIVKDVLMQETRGRTAGRIRMEGSGRFGVVLAVIGERAVVA